MSRRRRYRHRRFRRNPGGTIELLIGVTLAGALIFIIYKLYQGTMSALQTGEDYISSGIDTLESAGSSVVGAVEAPFSWIKSEASGAYDAIFGGDGSGAN